MDITNDICGFKLDKYQKEAVLETNKNILLLAGAGSGKTLTIIGKIRYLIEIKYIKQEEILCLSLTNEAVNNLKNKLKYYYNYDIDVLTFHKLALKIIKEEKEIYITNNSYLEYITNEYLDHIIKNNKKMQKNLLNIYNKKFIINTKKSYERLLKYKTKDIISFKKLIINFINLYKTNNYEKEYLNTIYKKENSKNKKIILFIYKVLNLYEEELKSQNMLDLNDILKEAINSLKNITLPYKYIIIDEYQDTSEIKYQLVKHLVEKTNSKVFAVGDDYQSIFAFTGCNLNIFLNFKKCFNNSEILTIPHIYRNSKEIVNTASNFIMKNKSQMKKNLRTGKTLDRPIKIIYTKNSKKTLEKLIKQINTKIMILGRNNNDLKDFTNQENITYLTVHKSKGLEEENVILINNENNIYGFPNKIKNHKLIKYLLKKETFKYEEERRLFYVAMTRTKNNFYLLVPKNNKSLFIKELLKNYKKYIEILNFTK